MPVAQQVENPLTGWSEVQILPGMLLLIGERFGAISAAYLSKLSAMFFRFSGVIQSGQVAGCAGSRHMAAALYIMHDSLYRSCGVMAFAHQLECLGKVRTILMATLRSSPASSV